MISLTEGQRYQHVLALLLMYTRAVPKNIFVQMPKRKKRKKCSSHAHLLCSENKGLFWSLQVCWPWHSLKVTIAPQTSYMFNLCRNTNVTFKRDMTVGICVANTLMIVSMTLIDIDARLQWLDRGKHKIDVEPLF